MTLTIQNMGISSYEEALKVQNSTMWDALKMIPLQDAIEEWLTSLHKTTARDYCCGFKRLIEIGLINPVISLQDFALVNHEMVVDKIKQYNPWTESTRQARAACYISFTKFLERRSKGMIKKAIPSTEGSSKTFFKIYDKVKTDAMTQSEWICFFEKLEILNSRDCLIGKLLIQGGKRISEVLSLQHHQINWSQNEITFSQSKTKGVHKETVITYSSTIMQDLKKYLGERTGYVFITCNGNQIFRNQICVSFEKAGARAGIKFKITPHVLRTSAVTYLKKQGFQDSDIMKITGHASAEMVHAYDKSSRSDNATKKVNLIT